jgi:hypothetical protein
MIRSLASMPRHEIAVGDRVEGVIGCFGTITEIKRGRDDWLITVTWDHGKKSPHEKWGFYQVGWFGQ